ncbi:MAG: PD40 domain-containing protein [Flavobacteriales bacterium]|nr:PD40 domain-containing protein [Flavobacteriales bacterium]
MFAQKNVEFTKDNFPDTKKEMKEAVKRIEEGGEIIQQYTDPNNGVTLSGGYKLALPFYEKAQKFNPNNALLNYKIGKCYLKGTHKKTESLQYFLKAYKLDPRVDNQIFYMIARGYHLRGEWDKAMNEYKKYQKMIPADATPKQKEDVAKKIIECETGKELSANPIRVFIDNLGNVINGKYPEYGAIISADESVMMFTSRREGSTGDKKEGHTHMYFEDVYISHHNGNVWDAPVNMGKIINSDGHDATVGLSPDGTKLLIYLDDKGDGNIYECFLRGEVWSKPKKLGKNINTDYHESSASFSFDSNTLYFVSNKPEGGMGAHDIYKSEWNADKERWGKPTNLGPNINTKYDEEAVFMHPDGKTMYFSSTGHNTSGGYDVFVSKFEGGMWQKPVNIGYPINSPDNDIFFVVSASGKHGYLSSHKHDEGEGEKDIYLVTFLGPEKEVILNNEDNLLANVAKPVKEIVIEPAVEVAQNRVTILKGVIRDIKTKEPVEARIEVIDNEASKIVASFTSNSKTGKYLVSLPAGKNYGIAVKSEGYLFHSENFLIPESAAAYKEVTKDVDLKKIEIGSVIVLKNIFFDTDKATLRPESTVELENVYKILTDNPSIKVELSGHTDSQGSDVYNLDLSDRRAKAVVNYLVKKGIPAKRLVPKGYGEAKPVATNETAEGRQMNRRTELKIIGI